MEALGFSMSTRFTAAVPMIFSLLNLYEQEHRASGSPPLAELELQAAVPALFSFIFWQQCLALLFCGGGRLRVYMTAVGRAVFTTCADVAAYIDA